MTESQPSQPSTSLPPPTSLPPSQPHLCATMLGWDFSYVGVGGGAPCICVRCIKKCASQLNLFGDPSAQRLTLNAVAVFRGEFLGCQARYGKVLRIPGMGKRTLHLKSAQSLEAGMLSFMCFSKKSSPSPAPSLSIITNF